MITILLVVICVAVYVLELQNPDLLYQLALTPEALSHGEYYRFLTSMFAHSLSPLHIGCNMVALWVVGRQLEEGMGKLKYLGVYLLSGLAGGLAYLASGATIPAVGASGAIFGLLGVALPYTRYHGSVIAMVVLNLGVGFVLPGVAWQAHLGGLGVGLLLGVLLYTLLPRREAAKQRALAEAEAERYRHRPKPQGRPRPPGMPRR